MATQRMRLANISSMSIASKPVVHRAQALPSAAAMPTEKTLMKMDVIRNATITAPRVLGVLWSIGLSMASLHFSRVSVDSASSRSLRTAWARLNVGGNLLLQDKQEVYLPDAPNLYQSGIISAVAASHSSPHTRAIVDRGH
ncbi:unnamed protein product [Fusarium graminearum]|uniref:Chromosome 2, complete genome n=1 Tax=Gibberella zeae (strain ATCC MYA-4620 / CBS 123657 / FGSC 9075 / NRRL 31084 / PH-1) TaxID=229533 RepID=A0A0E0S606_GIBZE|nr:hypothetical protein FG05_30106 [Fusarium graminearum]CEF78931.1 unnamed protein product [Fusarium graminearum]CZS82223.1 unnamed protein product [Fusarium graminearum]